MRPLVSAPSIIGCWKRELWVCGLQETLHFCRYGTGGKEAAEMAVVGWTTMSARSFSLQGAYSDNKI